MSRTHRKKLIEVALPLDAINKAREDLRRSRRPRGAWAPVFNAPLVRRAIRYRRRPAGPESAGTQAEERRVLLRMPQDIRGSKRRNSPEELNKLAH